MGTTFSEEELDTIIREVIGAERKILFETGKSTSKRVKDVRAIIDRRANQGTSDDT